MADPIAPFVGVLRSVKEVLAVLLVFGNGIDLAPTGGNMVDSAGIFHVEVLHRKHPCR